jgi:hypothetical protein
VGGPIPTGVHGDQLVAQVACAFEGHLQDDRLSQLGLPALVEDEVAQPVETGTLDLLIA